MNVYFKEWDLRLLYRLLGHEGHYSRVGSLDYSSKKYEQAFLQGEDQVIEYGRRFNGARNVFISRAFRSPDGAVISTNCMSFDLDPVRPKDTASTDEQHKEALSVGKRILGKYSGGYLASSGNGALLVYRLPSAVNDLNAHYAKEKELISELQKEFGNERIKIDHTSYAEAVIKAIGTFSTKGASQHRRATGWLNPPFSPFKPCSEILARLDGFKPDEYTTNGSADIKQLRQSAFNGDRSVADYHLVAFLKRSGVGPADALTALSSNPLGRKDERPDDQARLIKKIYGNDASVAIKEDKDAYFTALFTANPKSGLNTSLVAFDKTLGEFPSGEIITIAARSGFGKTTFGCTVAENCRKEGKKVLYFSTEMASPYIMHKLLALAKEIPLDSLVQKKELDKYKNKIDEYQEEFNKFPIIICDEFQPTIELVRNEMLKHKPDIVIFDHINQAGTHWEQVAQFMRGLKALTSEEKCSTIVLSQLNEPPRGSDGKELQSIRGDVRGSQEILYLSAIFAFFTNPFEVKGNFQPVHLHVAKNRYGISGGVVELTLDKINSKFIDCLEEHKENVE